MYLSHIAAETVPSTKQETFRYGWINVGPASYTVFCLLGNPSPVAMLGYLSYKKQTHKMGKICLLKINIKLNDYK